MKVSILSTSSFQSQTLIIPFSSTPEKLNQGLELLASTYNLSLDRLKKDFSAGSGETYNLLQDNQRIILLGFGSEPRFGEILKNFRSFSYKNKTRLDEKIGISFSFNNLPISPGLWVEAAVNGLLLGAYQLGKYKTMEETNAPSLNQPGSVLEIILPDEYRVEAEKAATRGHAIAESQMQIFDLVNAPSNHKRPHDLGKWALKSGKQYGYSVKVMDKEEIVKTGLHALLAVNQGSADPPAFIIMEYRPENPVKKIGLVGKGVTFDTGGLSIKPSI